ncbi:hypothetical protein KCG44_11450 [Pacificimonas sp. WHA3]|uniref:Secreted protein n=1 Tax=Pacificimonas pallii TaxID=2827236 RepID=A0ABS6SHM2_9SPHN|nr:hypothetical protein [Pacificimonas pallii]MBV7257401.1 hypothetical protein [Pacificimonas pallii]
MDKRFLLIAAAGFMLTICPCAADAQETPPATDSGVLVAPGAKRVPLDKFMPRKGCEGVPDDEICVTGDPYEEPEETPPPPDPGDRLLDVQSERSTLANTGSQTPMDCSLVGAAGVSGCAINDFKQWKKERELQKKREQLPIE